MRRILTAALLAPALALGACGPVNRSVESINQPIVQRADYVLDVSKDGLAAGARSPEGRRLAGWFAALQLGYGDSVSIDDPASPYGDKGTRDTVAEIIGEHGLLLSDATPVTAGDITPGAVRIVVSRSTASVPHCPNWDRPSNPDVTNSASSNYGCATNSNLAAMIANPEDMVRGQAAEGTDSRTVVRAITQYRSAATPALQQVNTRNGGQ